MAQGHLDAVLPRNHDCFETPLLNACRRDEQNRATASKECCLADLLPAVLLEWRTTARMLISANHAERLTKSRMLPSAATHSASTCGKRASRSWNISCTRLKVSALVRCSCSTRSWIIS